MDIPPDVIKKIDSVVRYFRTQIPESGVKWVSVDLLHLTIKFMGELPDEKLDETKATICKVVKQLPSFQINIQGLGMYPNHQKPRVVWLGIEGKEPIINIHHLLDDALEKIGIQPERRKFSPHLSLARLRRGTDQATVKEIGQTLSKFTVDSLGMVTVEHISLYKSKLTPQGPIHTLLQAAPLNKV